MKLELHMKGVQKCQILLFTFEQQPNLKRKNFLHQLFKMHWLVKFLIKHLCVCMLCVHTFVWGRAVGVHVWGYSQEAKGCHCVSSLSQPPWFLKQNLSLNLELQVWLNYLTVKPLGSAWLSSSWGLPVIPLPVPSTGVNNISCSIQYFYGCWESELRSLCLYNKHFIHWDISTTVNVLQAKCSILFFIVFALTMISIINNDYCVLEAK